MHPIFVRLGGFFFTLFEKKSWKMHPNFVLVAALKRNN